MGEYFPTLSYWRLQNLENYLKGGKNYASNSRKKAAQHPKFKNWFKQVNTGQPLSRAKYAVTVSKLKRLQKSPIPYFTKLLNENNGH